jgi:SpoVK/Ycf46/Vps4 family AAA+-type ATPase
MDTTTYYLLEKIRRNDTLTLYEIFSYIILIPLLSYTISRSQEYLKNIVIYLKQFCVRTNILKIESTKLVSSERRDDNFGVTSRTIFGLNNVILNKLNIKCEKSMYYDQWEDEFITIVVKCNNLHIGNGVYLTASEMVEKQDKYTLYQLKYELSSKSVNLNEYIQHIMKVYKKDVNKKNNECLFHYIYGGEDEGFKKYKLSDYKRPSLETFDHIINEHSEKLKKDILRLKDISYYKRTGLKRKKGYLFYGEPGCGKTSTVMAMANFDSRHIIEVPLTRIKKNREIEDIINMKITKLKKDKVIILFDEIDRAFKKLKDDKVEVNTTTNNIKSNMDDEFNLGSFLSRLDGIGNYEGMIIIATTNNIDNLDPALYRELRLTPIKFDCCRKVDIREMVENFYDIEVSDKEMECIPDRKIAPSKIKLWLEQYEDDYDGFMKLLE